MRFLTYFVFTASMFSNDLIVLHGENRDTPFLKEVSSRNSKSISDKSIYYIYGEKSESTKYISDGTVILKFRDFQTLDKIESFEKDYSLELLRKNSTGTYLFKNVDKNEDIINKSNKLFNLETVQFASPNWKRVRGLK